MSYIARGWAVVPLHDVTGGTCSCGSADPRHDATQGGKHPLATGWQNRGIRTAAEIQDAWARRPGANLGIVTGRASGVWVLDVDPDHGGDAQLAGLVAAFGALPETYTVRTGSGGTHYYWTMPDFDFTNSRGRLPLGLDVRGNASQVVAPPSYTLKGGYAVLLDVVPVASPGWLLGMVRPAERVEVERAPWDGGGWSGNGAQAIPDRGPAYAGTAVGGALGELAAAGVGERNTVAYRVARRLSELICSPWAGLDADRVWAGYMAAAAACDTDGGFTQSEAYDVLVKAWRDGRGHGVELPPADWYGTSMPWMPSPDFDQARQVPGGAGEATGPGGTLTDVAAPMINGPAEQVEGPPPPPDPFELAVRQEIGRLMVRRAAAERLDAYGRIETDFDQEFLDDAGLEAIAPGIPLVAGYLDRDTLARMNGPSGHGKSFVALDLAASVAHGRTWHGHAVTAGEAWYILAEGAPGMRRRTAAWCEMAGVASTGVRFIPRPVVIGGPEWAALIARGGRDRPALIILDTQARMSGEANENDATDMGRVVAALAELRAASGACVMLVHHRGLNGTHGRGSSAVKGALDTELDVSRVGTTVTVRTDKRKDDAELPPLLLTMNPVGTSMVLVGEADAYAGTPFVSPMTGGMSKGDLRALTIVRVLQETAAGGDTRARIATRALDRIDFGATPGSRTGSFSRAWDRLIDLGRIAKATGREAYFFVEVDGIQDLAPNPGKTVQGGPEVYIGV